MKEKQSRKHLHGLSFWRRHKLNYKDNIPLNMKKENSYLTTKIIILRLQQTEKCAR
jgi:hypothetical protein